LEFENSINTYFYFLWSYYRVKNDLKNVINTDFKRLYNDNSIFLDNIDLLDENWLDWEEEDFYNEKYKEKDNYYIFDKITPEWVEFCDILYIWDDNNISIFHIKDKFGQSIRDLVYQVENSTSLIHNQILSNSDWYFDKLYDFKIRNTINDWFNDRFNTLESFLDLFKDISKINIYLWIRYRANWGDYSLSKSLVPKVAILDLQKKVNNQYSVQNFKIIKL
jgi:hypothetical protein